jgi:DNA-binding PadR family transcriptional regulator
MSQNRSSALNLWSLTLLCLLRERPMHPYEMKRLIRERKNDQFLDLKRGSLYHEVGRLLQAGLIAEVETSRSGKRPERTVYRITPEGETSLLLRLRELLATPVHEPSWFFAAISFLVHLNPTEVLGQLGERTKRLEAIIAGLDATLREMTPRLGRLLLLECEYRRAMNHAELSWVRSLIEDLRAGSLEWNSAALLQWAASVAEASSPAPAVFQ